MVFLDSVYQQEKVYIETKSIHEYLVTLDQVQPRSASWERMIMLDKARFGDERVEDLVAAAKTMQPYLLEMAPRHEQNRRLDADVIKKLLAADMFKVAVPRRWGGL